MSDSSGNVILKGDLLEIANVIVIDNNLNANLASVNASQYKIGGAPFVDNSLNLAINNITGSSGIFNDGEFSNVISNIVNANQYKINGQSFIDSDLNLNVNSLTATSFNPDKITTSSVVISGKTVIDSNKNINASFPLNGSPFTAISLGRFPKSISPK